MGGTWLVRGAAAAVVAVLVGAWLVGVSGRGESSDPPAPDRTTPSSPAETGRPANEGAVIGKKVKQPRVREVAETPDDAVNEPTPDAVPVDDDPATPEPTSPGPTPDDPSLNPPPPTTPNNPPNNPPNQPSDECTELLGVLDCLLNPITGQP